MADDQELYDEFGNYIGPDLDSSDDDSSEASENEAPDDASDVSDMSRDGGGRADQLVEHEDLGVASAANAIVLHEDKVHYPSAEEVYGDGVRTAVLDEDAMDLEEPIVEPVRKKTFSLMRDEEEERRAYGADTVRSGKEVEDDLVSDQYLASLVANETTRTRRCLALVGHLHTGKTSLMDLLIEQTKVPTSGFGVHGPRAALEAHRGGGPRITDTLRSEQDRQMSIKSCPATLCLPDTRGKTYALTLIDCPGHTNFHDESVASLRVADGAALVVDAVEGIMLHTEMVIKEIISQGLPLVLVINKIDRLVLELKLPPDDMYHKLRNVIDSVNAFVTHQSNGRYPKLSRRCTDMLFRWRVLQTSIWIIWTCITSKTTIAMPWEDSKIILVSERISLWRLLLLVSGGMPTLTLDRGRFSVVRQIVLLIPKRVSPLNGLSFNLSWSRCIRCTHCVWARVKKTRRRLLEAWEFCWERRS
jgi:U5 small nuclear ribonucleoprotein component